MLPRNQVKIVTIFILENVFKRKIKPNPDFQNKIESAEFKILITVLVIHCLKISI